MATRQYFSRIFGWNTLAQMYVPTTLLGRWAIHFSRPCRQTGTVCFPKGEKMPKIDSLTVRLKEQLLVIENQMLEFLDASTIEQFQDDDPFNEDPVVFIGPQHYWAETDESQKRLQLKLLRSYSFWFEQFQLLFCDSSQELQKQIVATHTAITDLIEQKRLDGALHPP
jgi:hypothetical protein